MWREAYRWPSVDPYGTPSLCFHTLFMLRVLAASQQSPSARLVLSAGKLTQAPINARALLLRSPAIDLVILSSSMESISPPEHIFGSARVRYPPQLPGNQCSDLCVCQSPLKTVTCLSQRSSQVPAIEKRENEWGLLAKKM